MAEYFQAITAVSFDVTTLTGSFQSLNGSGFSDDVKILKMYNPSASGIDISFDGVTKHDYWPPGGTLIIDFQTNHGTDSSNAMGRLHGRKGQIIYGRTTTTSAQLQISGYK